MQDFIWCLTETIQSIYSKSSASKTTNRSPSSSLSSESQLMTVKIADCAAELAAKKAEIEMEDVIAAQRQKLKRLENQREIEIIAAKLKAYSEADSSESHDKGSPVHSSQVPHKELKIEQTCENSKKIQTNSAANNELLLTQVLHDTMVLTRLPAPEQSSQKTHYIS